MSLSDERTSLTSNGARLAYNNVDTEASRLVLLVEQIISYGLLGVVCMHFIFF